MKVMVRNHNGIFRDEVVSTNAALDSINILNNLTLPKDIYEALVSNILTLDELYKATYDKAWEEGK